jgi:NDP-sugar pyrophosphorylase family protein
MSQLFQAFFADGRRFRLSIGYSFEDKPLGTAGPIALLLDRLDEDFIVMNGDC